MQYPYRLSRQLLTTSHVTRFKYRLTRLLPQKQKDATNDNPVASLGRRVQTQRSCIQLMQFPVLRTG
jgi:hypothetical protein